MGSNATGSAAVVGAFRYSGLSGNGYLSSHRAGHAGYPEVCFGLAFSTVALAMIAATRFARNFIVSGVSPDVLPGA